MTANSSGGYTVVQSPASINATETRKAWSLFNGVTVGGVGNTYHGVVGSTYQFDGSGIYTGSESLGGVSGTWLYIRLPVKISLEFVKLTSRAAVAPRTPRSGTFLGSNDGVNWTFLSSFSDTILVNPSGTSSPEYTYTYNVNSTVKYDYIGFVMERIGNTYPNFEELELYGIPEYDPEAHGVDVVVKSVPNVPNTDWLEVYYDAKDYTSGVVPDLSTNSLNGTLTNGATFDNSDGIGKFTFDGSNDYISGSIPSTFTGNQTYTFSVWVKPDSHPSSGFVGIFEAGTRSTNDAIGLYFDTGKIIHLAYGNNLATTTLAPVGQWTHITGTYTSGDRKVYANGVLLGQDTYSALTVAGTTLVVGANAGGTQPFTGSIANFRLFNRVLTTDEIYQLYAYQKEYFSHGALGMTLKAGRLGIGTSEPRAALDVRGDVRFHNIVHMLATDSGSIDGANGVYVNFDTVQEGYGIAMEGTDGTFRITEQAGAGLYMIDGQISWTSNGTSTYATRNATLRIRINNDSLYSEKGYGLGAHVYLSNPTYSQINAQSIARCEVGDTIRLYAASTASSINLYCPASKMLIYKIQSI